MPNKDKHDLLSLVPGVDSILELTKKNKDFNKIPEKVIKASIRHILANIRNKILDQNKLDNNKKENFKSEILIKILKHAKKTISPKLIPVINATGIVLHTNLGRAILCKDAIDNIIRIAFNYSNLEFNIAKGKRGIRYNAVENLICELTGAEAAMAVNNNAGAVLLCLDTLANKKEVIISRGELVEIGGSFRIPDVMEKSGSILKEVGTTNRTHIQDYEKAVTPDTGLLLKVHTSNYKIQGFTSSVSLGDLVSLGKDKNIPVMEDLGSGTLIDLSKYKLGKEPTVLEVLASKPDIVTFSSDKLLGGPQAGIILGNKALLKKIKANPLTRALRIDKLTLAALESTLNIYRDENKAIKKIPCLNMLTKSFKETAKISEKMLDHLKNKITDKRVAEFECVDLSSLAGGGALPELSLPSRCVAVKPIFISPAELEKKMRLNKPSIIGRIDNNRFIIDPRTLQKEQENIILNALESIFILSKKNQTKIK